MTEEVKNSWHTIIMGLQQLMRHRPPESDMFRAQLYRKRSNKRWKPCVIDVSLFTIFIYHSDKVRPPVRLVTDETYSTLAGEAQDDARD